MRRMETHGPFLVDLFHALVATHIVTGSIGLLAFWAPVLGAKGGGLHRTTGRIFVVSMLATGTVAVGISLSTVNAPAATHPHLTQDPAWIAGIFGWMMLHLAILTVNLAWYGWSCIRNRRDHALHRRPLNLALQALLFLAAANCFVRGLALGEAMMAGIAFVGFATVGTNLFFMLRDNHSPLAWQKEHLKGLVGAGISVYTAFFAFGAVRLLPEAALNPALWSAPLVTGLAIILFHWRKIDRRLRPAASA